MNNLSRFFIIITMGLALTLPSGCSSGKGTTKTSPMKNVTTGAMVADLAQKQIGAPYRFGGETPTGFDCSGLIRYVYQQIGITVPHSSRLLYKQAKKIRLANVLPGDLLFFNISKNKVSHVGIYATTGQFIHAPSSGKHVSIARLDNPYWKKRLIGAGRLH